MGWGVGGGMVFPKKGKRSREKDGLEKEGGVKKIRKTKNKATEDAAGSHPPFTSAMLIRVH